MTYLVVPSSSREEWLEQRKKVVSATDVHKIRDGTDAQFSRLYKEKLDNGFRGTRFTKWGHQREPVIARWVSEKTHGRLFHNEQLVVREDEPRFGATPDMLSEDGELIGEIKTVKVSDESEVWRSWSDVCRQKPEYASQVQWQMFVTGAKQCWFAFEPYEDVDGWFHQLGMHHFVVTMDGVVQRRLRRAAERFLAFSPPDVVEVESAGFELRDAIQRVRECREIEAGLRARLREVEGDRRAAEGDLVSFLESPGTYSVEGDVVEVTGGRLSRSFDRKAWEADHPELVEKYMAERLSAPQVKIS